MVAFVGTRAWWIRESPNDRHSHSPRATLVDMEGPVFGQRSTKQESLKIAGRRKTDQPGNSHGNPGWRLPSFARSWYPAVTGRGGGEALLLNACMGPETGAASVFV